MKYIFIVNETAGRGKYKKILPNIEIECKSKKINYEIRYITKDLKVAKILLEYKKRRKYNLCCRWRWNNNKNITRNCWNKNKLGIIPSGSGNDTYRTVKILPKKRKFNRFR